MAVAFSFILAFFAVFQFIGFAVADNSDINLCGQSDWWNSTEVPYSCASLSFAKLLSRVTLIETQDL